MQQQPLTNNYTLSSWTALTLGTVLACSLPLIDARPGIMAHMGETFAALAVGLLALASGVIGIVFGLFGEAARKTAATETAGATSAMAAVWANVVFVFVYVAAVLIRTS